MNRDFVDGASLDYCLGQCDQLGEFDNSDLDPLVLEDVLVIRTR